MTVRNDRKQAPDCERSGRPLPARAETFFFAPHGRKRPFLVEACDGMLECDKVSNRFFLKYGESRGTMSHGKRWMMSIFGEKAVKQRQESIRVEFLWLQHV